MNFYKHLVLFLIPLTCNPLAQAATESGSTIKGWFDTFTDNVAQTWDAPQHYDLYVPAITWHARFAYDKDKTDR